MMDWQIEIALFENLKKFQVKHDISDETLRAMLKSYRAW